MRDIVVYYARCNREINKMMNLVIQQGVPEPYSFALQGYFFKTLGQLLDHLFCTDMIWMKAFSDLDTAGLNLETEVRAVPGYGDRVFESFEPYLAHRTKLDDFIVRYMQTVDESVFSKTVSRKARDGSLIERESAKAMIHFFNHQTHHRGQVSNILDNLGVENNYSNMIFLDV